MAKKQEQEKPGKVIGNSEEIAQYILPGYRFSSTWSSPEKFAQYVENMDKKKAWHDAGWEHDEEWSGTKDMETAIKMARYGWKEGGEQVERLRERIEAANPQSPRLIRYGIAGTTPNVPRAIAGNVFNMRVPDQAKSRKKPVLTLVSNMSANCGVPAHQITNRAAAVAAIIDKIESSGFSCEVISTAVTEGGGYWDASDPGYTAACSVVVKRSDQPVDTIRLAYGLGHASMFRRLVFADWGMEPSAKSGLGRGLGHSTTIQTPKDEDFDIKGIYTIPSAEEKGKYFDSEERSMTDGLNYLMKKLQDQGCPAFARMQIPEPNEEEAAPSLRRKRRG